jgi:hypothetical protein
MVVHDPSCPRPFRLAGSKAGAGWVWVRCRVRSRSRILAVSVLVLVDWLLGARPSGLLWMFFDGGPPEHLDKEELHRRPQPQRGGASPPSGMPLRAAFTLAGNCATRSSTRQTPASLRVRATSRPIAPAISNAPVR